MLSLVGLEPFDPKSRIESAGRVLVAKCDMWDRYA